MKDYYAILNVRRDASAPEIKRAYRLLAVRYHPDKNSDPAAEHLFKEINEAYEVLGDVFERQKYDSRFSYQRPEPEVTVQSETRRHRDPAYRRKSPGVRVKSERQRMLELMAEYVPMLQKVVAFALVVSGLFFVDFILPKKETAEKIIQSTGVRSTSSRSTVPQWRITTNTGKVIDILYSNAVYFRRGNVVKIESSRILGIVLYISSDQSEVRVSKSLYGNFSFAPLALFATAIFGWYHRRRVDYAFNSGVVSILLLILNFVLYLALH